MNKFYSLITIFLIFSNCAKDKSIYEKNLSANDLYNKASICLKEDKIDKAIDFFSKINQEYPYSDLAAQSQMMEVYSNYIKKDYDMVINISDDFIQTYPSNQFTSYIYYLKALSYYDQIQDVNHDQKITELAKEAAVNLISRFPGSDYSRDFKIKISLIEEHLAGKEMNIGRFYLHNGNILAAVGRFNIVVQNYQTTIHIEEALYRLIECYLKLGIEKEANKFAIILGYNYPYGKWYKYSNNILNVNLDNVAKPSN